MHSVIFISIRNFESKRNIEQNKFTNCKNLFPNPILSWDFLGKKFNLPGNPRFGKCTTEMAKCHTVFV